MPIDWDAFEDLEAEQRRNFNHGAFSALSPKYVPGEGDNPEAFIIGEAPGAYEEIQRRPFVGDSGQVLRQLMDIAGLRAGHTIPPDAENCWLTNVIKFRPPKNRTPTEPEVKAARPYLRREWKAVGSPRLIIPVGGIALWAVTGKRISILRAAGKCHWYAGKSTGKGGPTLAIWPMVHPSFVLRQKPGNEQLQALIEHDWDKLRKWRQKERTSPIGYL